MFLLKNGMGKVSVNFRKMKRKGLSKKVRFEVFKRDGFTCQYCGAKAPDVQLNVDHIEPVSKGGTNDILNLITSCFSCNSGKGDRLISDDSAISKQRKQLSDLQERREQIELMMDWKTSLQGLKDDVSSGIIEYLNNNIKPYELNETGQLRLSNHLKKFSAYELMDAIDIASEKYLKYDSNGDLIKQSIEALMGKIGGIMALGRTGPVKQKASYIKGIARNRFHYWDNRRGSIIIQNLIKAIQDDGHSEEVLLEYFESQIIPLTKMAKHWTEWKDEIELLTHKIIFPQYQEEN